MKKFIIFLFLVLFANIASAQYYSYRSYTPRYYPRYYSPRYYTPRYYPPRYYGTYSGTNRTSIDTSEYMKKILEEEKVKAQKLDSAYKEYVKTQPIETVVFNFNFNGNFIGTNAILGKGDLVVGYDISIYTGKGGGVGKHYSNISSRILNADLYQTVVQKQASYSVIVGKVFRIDDKEHDSKFIVYSNIGIGHWATYKNAYDRHHILNWNGYYHTSYGNKNEMIVGLGITYTIKYLAFSLSSDNFNDIRIGLGMSVPQF
jgi:hypothetical protein